MGGRIRLFLWRHQRTLTVLYLGALATAWAGFLVFTFHTPARYDTGLAVAVRARAYHASFEDVHEARAEIEAGRVEDARARLEGFLQAHNDVQRSQLQMHAIVDAHELLADLHMRRERPRQAIKLYETLTKRVPLHYRAWHLRGLAEKSGAGVAAAAESLDRAFRLSLNNVAVVEDYLSVLAELSAIEKILWVADEFARAERRAMPIAVVKVGTRRGAIQRRALDWAGIPIEHGTFFRSSEHRGLARGAQKSIPLPPELFADWPQEGGIVTIQVRFEHVYGDVRIEALRCRTGSEPKEFRLSQGSVRTLHQPHSGREAYSEFDLEFDPSEGTDYEIVYSCPEHNLSADALATIDKARANVRRRGG